MGDQEGAAESSATKQVPKKETDRSATQRARETSPSGVRTPPSRPQKQTLTFPDSLARTASEPVDAEALARALKDYDEAGRRRERTPGASPQRKRQRINPSEKVYGDRSVCCLRLLVKILLTIPDSFLIEKGRISRPPTACCMRMAAHQRLRDQSDEFRMASCTFKKVCIHSQRTATAMLRLL